ncbi:MAG TPA: hypothetical protein VL049_05390 [Candidatus Dormibacteraeota bacterium]|nr:hypothetical protein [Candidatus Dormibacteraeota bacterium]
MRHSIRRLVMAALACAFVATVAAAPVMACDGQADSDAPSAPSGK